MLVIRHPPVCPLCGRQGWYVLHRGHVLDGRDPPRTLNASGPCGHTWVGELPHEFTDRL